MAVSPPAPRLPALNALRAFEAAARLGGFSAAAAELGVTPGAVAAHVKALEDDLGAALFERHSRGVRLTALGRRVLPGFVAAFDALGEAVREMRDGARPRAVHVAALPCVAELWLAPRLRRLRERRPDVDVSISALETPPDLKRTPFDLCLFFTEAPPPGARVLGHDTLLPVCAPAVATRLRRPEDLLDAVLLTDTTWAGDWAAWAAIAMPGRDPVPRGPVFSLYALALAQAIEGAGVLIGHRILVERELAEGRLVAPFPIEVTLPRRLAAWTPRRAAGAAEAVLGALVD